MSLTHMTGIPYGLSGIQPGHHRHATLTHPGHRNASSRLIRQQAPRPDSLGTLHRTPHTAPLRLTGTCGIQFRLTGTSGIQFRLTGTLQCMALERLTDMKRRSTYGLRGSDVAARYIQRHLLGPARNQPPRAVGLTSQVLDRAIEVCTATDYIYKFPTTTVGQPRPTRHDHLAWSEDPPFVLEEHDHLVPPQHY
ncbi:uncharacterized protein LOC142985530 [Anticarsia gemmatalis]|uniref:uncharacterized protein LOC142985530 n=1 Tax=Anticarsia gemmatalis TaxID=129554 RepID=UPI003F76A6C7